MYDYFYGAQGNQYTFVKIPKDFFRYDALKKTTSEAKLLYGLLLDRMSLSVQNKWRDEKNRVYIIYQIQEIQDDLSIGRGTAMKVLGELETIGLVEKRKRGHGLPDLLYVKNFISKEESCEKEMDVSGTELDYLEVQELNFKKSKNWTQEVQKMDLRSPKIEPLYSNTEESKTEDNNTNINNASSSRNVYSDEFEELWKAYPRKIDKGRAFKLYKARIKDGHKHAEIMEAVEAYSSDCKKMKTEQCYIKHLATFLSADKPFLEYVGRKKVDRYEVVDVMVNPFD